MDAKLYSDVINGKQGADLSHHKERSNGQKNTILHLAAKSGKGVQLAEDVLSFHPSLLYEQNIQGNTPLHIAAKLGDLEMAKCLVDWEKKSNDVEQDRKLLTMVNLENDTALHEAVRYNHFPIVKFLVEEKQDLVSLVNGTGESPLFMAVDRCLHDAAFHILCNIPSTNSSNIAAAYAGRNGMNVLHAAVIRAKKCYRISTFEEGLLNLVKNLFCCRICCRALEDKKNAIGNISGHFSLVLTVKQRVIYRLRCHGLYPHLSRSEKDFFDEVLNKQESILTLLLEKDDFGWTPLHCASYIGSMELVERFVDKSNNLAYIKNKEGMSALHLSAKKGHVDVIGTLMRKCPEICELLDDNNRTALHVAVESKKKNVVKFFLESLPFQDLVNNKDKDGNTALHLASIEIDIEILEVLSDDSKIDKGAINNEGKTFLDIVLSDNQITAYGLLEIVMKLKTVNVLPSLEQKFTRETNKAAERSLEIKTDAQQAVDKERKQQQDTSIAKEKQQLDLEEKKAVGMDFDNINLVIITIISAVTFAAAFTIPGGLDNRKGTAVSKGRGDFKFFLLFDSLAFVFSSVSMIIHFSIRILGRLIPSRTYKYFWLPLLTIFSVITMVLAFEQGIEIVYHEKSDIFNASRYTVSYIFIGILSIFIGTSAIFPIVVELPASEARDLGLWSM
ncbi:protein ACCELERATED CELL DEATH 6-like [Ziziphus jujuba]|uniref:Protein ACCELERATED CELL DEATH 6-like n=1 Tax=Ziziphus jujuba TaxID=326968 RepID=A0ABM3IK70_ZIZJJ|nr:protein ACCELERATED CELL DEATH 6-like [Ziziphus jujuba]